MFVKSWGSKGTEPGQFATVRAIAVDAQGNVYVADSGNKRIQVFDSNGTFKTQITNVGTPPGALHHARAEPGSLFVELQSAERHRRRRRDLQAEAGRHRRSASSARPGGLPKEFNFVNAIDCRSENNLLVGEIGNLRVQKVSLH